jgi:hypothetical protein
VLEEKFPAFMVDATKIRDDHAWFAEKAAKPLTLAALSD